jgi:hypothetical protein
MAGPPRGVTISQELCGLRVDRRAKTAAPRAAATGRLRYGDTNGYFFRISENQTFAFSVLVKGKWTTLIEPTRVTAIRPGRVNRLTVIADNSLLYLYVNNQYVGGVVNDQLKNGEVGIALDLDADTTTAIAFDNFQVRTPPR